MTRNGKSIPRHYARERLSINSLTPVRCPASQSSASYQLPQFGVFLNLNLLWPEAQPAKSSYMVQPSLVRPVKLASEKSLCLVNNSHDESFSLEPPSFPPLPLPSSCCIAVTDACKERCPGSRAPGGNPGRLSTYRALLFLALHSIHSIVVSELFASLSAFFPDSISRCRFVPTL